LRCPKLNFLPLKENEIRLKLGRKTFATYVSFTFLDCLSTSRMAMGSALEREIKSGYFSGVNSLAKCQPCFKRFATRVSYIKYIIPVFWNPENTTGKASLIVWVEYSHTTNCREIDLSLILGNNT
jgi:hypothetical protein